MSKYLKKVGVLFIFMLTKRQFMGLHEQAVLGVRAIKNYNDQLNKRIGVNNDISLYYETQAEMQSTDDAANKVTSLIAKMEEKYLDPDTSRKIGVLKQQFRIQEERRSQLIASLSQVTKTIAFQREKPKRTPKHSLQPMEMEYDRNTSKTSDSRNSKRSMVTDSSIEEHQTQLHMDSEFDYEIQRKLLQEKRQFLGTTHQQINNIRQLAYQTSNMVYDQGDRLDIIGDDLFTSYKNMELTNKELDEANQQHKKVRNKRVCLSFLVLFILFAAVAFFFFIS